ncbi:acid phosphatase [Halenospora varia]|nr:acid phosphatase [Halenospora varia]
MRGSLEEARSLMGNRSEDPDGGVDEPRPRFSRPGSYSIVQKAVIAAIVLIAAYCSLGMIYQSILAASGAKPMAMSGSVSKSSKKLPYYFDPNPELWPGPTATGRAPFLAQETVVPNLGQDKNETRKRLWGHLSPYHPAIEGWGVEEFPVPIGAIITQLHTLHRHGSRYPTIGANVEVFGALIANVTGKFKATSDLSFLNSWSYGLGAEIMVPAGRLQLFESGVLHNYMYAHLYDPKAKIIVRSTTQKRMRESVWNFLSGFFGLDWAEKDIDVGYGIEGQMLEGMSGGWNNSLAGYDNCPNANTFRNMGGLNASSQWVDIYLYDATERLNFMLTGIALNTKDVYAMQTMCPYETAAYGYSPFCDLFTSTEWQNFEYSIDLQFSGGSAYESPVGRATGLGWLQEFAARLENHTLTYSGSQINVTLDSHTRTFPLNQTLYFDFSHDTNIMSVITALGFTQFGQVLPADHHPGKHNLTVSHVTPFGARLDIEVIRMPHPLLPNRSYDESGEATSYLRFKLNERTLPHPDCGGDREDGLCHLDTFLKLVKDEEALAMYDYACFGEYEAVPYGQITDGRPLSHKREESPLEG